MNSSELRTHLASIGVKPAGVEYILQSAMSPPEMRLRSGPQHNIVGDISTSLRTYLDDAVEGDVVSRMQIASLSVEHAYIVHLENRGNVLLALNHPLPVPLTITNAIGRTQRINYTCDTLVVDPTRAWATELKTEEEVRELVKNRPADWRQTKSGYEYVPAKEHFASLGLDFLVVVSSDLPWLRTQNMQILTRLRPSECPQDEELARELILSHVKSHSPCSLQQLQTACKLLDVSPVLRLIKEGAIHVDLDRARLSCPETRSICASPESARNVATALASVQSLARISTAVPFANGGDPWHLSEHGYRLTVIAGLPAKRETKEDGVEKLPPSLRTKQRWAKAHREGGPMAVAPKWPNSGNRVPRLEPWHQTFLHDQIKAARRSTNAPSRTKAHVDYSNALEDMSTKRGSSQKPVSYGYFCRLWNLRHHNAADAYERGGRRLANAAAPHRDVDKQVPMVTGPFQAAHVDHCLAPSHSTSHADGEGDVSGLPWLTLLVDDWETEPLAMVLSFKRPSAATNLKLLRNCARRHGRVPHAIFSDHGSDFKGNVFVGALGALNLHGFHRAEANPRSGQPVERTFSTFAESVCRGYEGFALDIPNARAISADKHPSKGKNWEFQDLAEHCEHLLFNVIPNLDPIGGGDSKLQKRLRYESVYGKQGSVKTIDLTFLVATAPPIKEIGCFEPSGAIRLGEKRFYSTELVGADLGRRRPPLRKELEDKSIIYFAYKGNWHVAKARDALRNYGRSDDVIDREAQDCRRPTAVERNQRRRSLHSRPVAKEPASSTAVPESAVAPTSQTPTRKRVSLADVRTATTLPPAFATDSGGNQ